MGVGRKRPPRSELRSQRLRPLQPSPGECGAAAPRGPRGPARHSALGGGGGQGDPAGGPRGPRRAAWSAPSAPASPRPLPVSGAGPFVPGEAAAALPARGPARRVGCGPVPGGKGDGAADPGASLPAPVPLPARPLLPAPGRRGPPVSARSPLPLAFRFPRIKKLNQMRAPAAPLLHPRWMMGQGVSPWERAERKPPSHFAVKPFHHRSLVLEPGRTRDALPWEAQG